MFHPFKNCICWQPTPWIWNFLIGEWISTTLWHPFGLNWSFLCSNTHVALHSPLGLLRIYFWSWTWAFSYSVNKCLVISSFPGIWYLIGLSTFHMYLSKNYCGKSALFIFKELEFILYHMIFFAFNRKIVFN